MRSKVGRSSRQCRAHAGNEPQQHDSVRHEQVRVGATVGQTYARSRDVLVCGEDEEDGGELLFNCVLHAVHTIQTLCCTLSWSI